jgi:hypothetical protein
VKDKQMAGDHAVKHCRGQCLEICGNMGSSGSESGAKNGRIPYRKMERCMTMVVYREMQKQATVYSIKVEV